MMTDLVHCYNCDDNNNNNLHNNNNNNLSSSVMVNNNNNNSSSIAQPLHNEVLEQQQQQQYRRRNENNTNNNDNNTTILLAFIELDLDYNNNNETFTTKLRIRTSECIVNNNTNITSNHLYTRIQQHLAAASSSSSVNIGNYYYKTDSTTIYVYDNKLNDYVILKQNVHDDNIVEQYGSRLRIRVMEKKEEEVEHRLAIKGRYFDNEEFSLFSNGKFTIGGKTLTFHENPNQPNAGTGFNVWDGALLLSKYLEYKPEIVCNKKVLELGAGCGVSGISAAILGAKHVTLTDLPEIISQLNINIEQNQQYYMYENVVSAQECDWYNPPSTLIKEKFDIILVADCIWMENLVQPLLNVIEKLTDNVNNDDTYNVTIQKKDDKRTDDNNNNDNTFVTADKDLKLNTIIGNQSFSYTELSIEEDNDNNNHDEDDSPVNSWTDIYRQQNNNKGYYYYSCNADDEASFSSLHEPPPDSELLLSSTIPTNTPLTNFHESEETTTSTTIKQKQERNDSDITLKHSSIQKTKDVDSSKTTVLFAYQQRGKATDDAFRHGIEKLFRHIEVIDNPTPNMNNNNNIPDVFFLLECRR